MKLVECIANFSEGRRAEVVDAIAASIESVDGIHLVDRHSDEDHNRTVITFIGPPRATSDAAYAGISKAAELIDMESHKGEHPRLGATDVVPFVPIREVTMDECVELARELGQRVAHDLGIPVYLYEAAATRPDRVNLADVRRGEYEELKLSIVENPDRAPDFGPKELGSAGATVIGARNPLIAFNVYLTTEDVEVAKVIAKHVRHSGGGLRFVKALGLLVEGRAQVSMNLTDFTRTPIHRVVEMIRSEARRHGVDVHGSELVGLTPQAALIDAAAWYLQLDEFEPGQLIESHLAGTTEESFLDRLADGDPTPGGGSAAAQSGAMAAALVAMVGRLTIGKNKYANVEHRAKAIVWQADILRGDLEAAVTKDAQAFDGVMKALRMPKVSGAEKAARA
ncbi:MAG: glutamate formimidoyltransferase, partial [Anaerolineales bacterium]